MKIFVGAEAAAYAKRAKEIITIPGLKETGRVIVNYDDWNLLFDAKKDKFLVATQHDYGYVVMDAKVTRVIVQDFREEDPVIERILFESKFQSDYCGELDDISGYVYLDVVPASGRFISGCDGKPEKKILPAGLQDLIYEVIAGFAAEHYGEEPDDASYNLEALAETVANAIGESKFGSENKDLSWQEKRRIFEELQDFYYKEDIESRLLYWPDYDESEIVEKICAESLVETLKRNLEHSDPYFDSYWEVVNSTIRDAIRDERGYHYVAQ